MYNKSAFTAHVTTSRSNKSISHIYAIYKLRKFCVYIETQNHICTQSLIFNLYFCLISTLWVFYRSHKMSVFRMLFFICLVGTIYGKPLTSDLGTAGMDDTKEFGNKEMSRQMDFGFDSATFSSDAQWCPIGPGLCGVRE